MTAMRESESDGTWGEQAAHNSAAADEYDRCDRLPEPGENAPYDAWTERKGITTSALTRMGARISGFEVVYPFPDGNKFFNLVSRARRNTKDAEFKQMKRVRGTASTGEKAFVVESETDCASLSDACPEWDVYIQPVGARGVKAAFKHQLDGCTQVLLGHDADDAGHDGALKFLELIPGAQRFAPPEGYKDWNEAISSGVTPELPMPNPWGMRELLPFDEMDFDAELPDPVFAVVPLMPQPGVGVISADTGAGKSWVSEDLYVAVARRRRWLDVYEVHAKRLLYIDQENMRRTYHPRYVALGMTNADRDQVKHVPPIGVRIGEPAWNGRLEDTISYLRPDIVVIDTVAASTTAEVNNNDLVAELFSILRPLAVKYGCTFVLLAHHKKTDGRSPARNGSDLMGARQWSGQADFHIQLNVTERVHALTDELELAMLDLPPDPDGTNYVTRTTLCMSMPKDRDGEIDELRAVTITSVKQDETRKLLRAWVKDAGPYVASQHGGMTKADAMAVEIALLVHGHASPTMTTADIAIGVGVTDTRNGTFTSAVNKCLIDKTLAKLKKGTYAPGPTVPVEAAI